jgi:hypothetical protein
MKKNLKALAVLVAAFIFTSCATFTGTSTSVWSDGLWIIPWLTGIGSLVFLGFAYRSSKSGSVISGPNGEEQSDENVPIYKIGTFWYGITCLIATLLIIWNVVSNK